MSRPTDLLTVAAIKAAQPRAKLFNLFDGRALALQVQPSGGKWWRFAYSRPVSHKRNTLRTHDAPSNQTSASQRLTFEVTVGLSF
jgi:hypothetical protein